MKKMCKRRTTVRKFRKSSNKSRQMRRNPSLTLRIPVAHLRYRSGSLQTRRYKRGGNKVKCCMCEKTVAIDGSLQPRACLEKHGSASHRICQDCWWNAESGFAREGVSHECPGCKKGLPLTLVKPSTTVNTVIDLTDDA